MTSVVANRCKIVITLLGSDAVTRTVQTNEVQEITCHVHEHGRRTKPRVVRRVQIKQPNTVIYGQEKEPIRVALVTLLFVKLCLHWFFFLQMQHFEISSVQLKHEQS